MQNLLILLLAVFISACSLGEESLETPPQKQVEKTKDEKIANAYRAAQREYGAGNMGAAKLAFDKIEEDFPYSSWAKNAQINSAFISYRQQEYDESILKLRRFIRFYPQDDFTPYAYYMIALNYYEQIVDVGRDQEITVKAQSALQSVINRYEGSKYAKDAVLKLDLVRDHLAGREMNIGRYYLNRKEYNAALGRFSEVVKNYQTTSHAPEALHRLVELYLLLGITPEAKKYAAILGHNYPGSEWYKDSYKNLTGTPKQPAKPEQEEGWGFFNPF